MFALIGSFILSRTLVPTMANFLMHALTAAHAHGRSRRTAASRNPLKRFQMRFEARFARSASAIASLLVAGAAAAPKGFMIGFLVCVVLSFALMPFLGKNFFPAVDSGQILMHVRAQPGTRIEETARLFDLVERTVRQVIPPSQLENITDNIGLPFSGINMAYQNTGTIGPEDGDALISLNDDHGPTADYVQQLRTVLPQKFPGTTFSFLPADIVSQILNFGLPAPIDLQVIGNDQQRQLRLRDRAAASACAPFPASPMCASSRSLNYPQLNVDVDRTLAGEVGLTQRDVANSLLVTLSGSGQVKTEFLAQQQERRVLSDRRPDAAIPDRQHIGSGQYPGDLGRLHRHPAIPRRTGARSTPGTEPGRGVALQRAAGHRHLRRYPGARPRRRCRATFEHIVAADPA